MNKFKFLSLLCLSFLFFTLTSCDKENDNNTPASIEGIWKFAMSGEDGDLYWILKDNVFVYVELGDPTPDYSTYLYDEDEQVLVVFYDNEGPREFKVVELTSNRLRLKGSNGESGTFIRYNGTLRDLEKALDVEIEL